jgi:hypothetical protein
VYLFLVAIPTSRRPRSRPGPSGVYAPIADGQVLANGNYRAWAQQSCDVSYVD